ncbi:MAG: N-acetylmuramidase [Deltaproteobacteria bacterium]|nr:N-acetylmuramidase [Deltaproteobacteria bacterium]
MAEFEPAFEKMILNEGGFKLHEVKGDRGGMTYAGIARNYHHYWPGWQIIERDPNDPRLTGMVRDFYKEHFWDRVKGDDIENQKIAQSLFDFSVNAGTGVAAKLAQMAVGAMPDGAIGPKTLEALNAENEEIFVLKYALLKVARYAEICNEDRGQVKFLLGWINRTLGGLGNV